MTPRTVVLAACLLAAPALFAQKLTLAPFPMDGSFASTTVQDMTMVMTLDTDDSSMAAMGAAMQQEMAMNQTTTASLTIESDATGKNITMTTERVTMEMDAGGQQMTFDSADPDASSMPGAAQNSLVGEAIQFRFEGGAVEALNFDEVIEGLIEGDDEERRALQRQALNQALDKSTFEQLLGIGMRMLPANPIGAGDTFDVDVSAPMTGIGDVTMKATFTVGEIEGSTVRYSGPMTVSAVLSGAGLPFQMDMSGGGTMAVVYNAETGEQEVASDLTMAAQMDMTGVAGGTEKAVMNMLVSMQQTQTVTKK